MSSDPSAVHLVDADCGHGGPGLWVAAVTGARLIGIDPDEAALAAARRQADQAGFDVLGYEETHAWRDQQQRTGQALLAAAAELAAESGSTAAQQRARITEMNANMATITRRVLVTAERRAGDELPVVAPS
jgi:tRNA/tmRNA/rRNA uracil-C5-methylase (TrmA/RlmC/RlmD family)